MFRIKVDCYHCSSGKWKVCLYKLHHLPHVLYLAELELGEQVQNDQTFLLRTDTDGHIINTYTDMTNTVSYPFSHLPHINLPLPIHSPSDLFPLPSSTFLSDSSLAIPSPLTRAFPSLTVHSLPVLATPYSSMSRCMVSSMAIVIRSLGSPFQMLILL